MLEFDFFQEGQQADNSSDDDNLSDDGLNYKKTDELLTKLCEILTQVLPKLVTTNPQLSTYCSHEYIDNYNASGNRAIGLINSLFDQDIPVFQEVIKFLLTDSDKHNFKNSLSSEDINSLNAFRNLCHQETNSATNVYRLITEFMRERPKQPKLEVQMIRALLVFLQHVFFTIGKIDAELHSQLQEIIMPEEQICDKNLNEKIEKISKLISNIMKSLSSNERNNLDALFKLINNEETPTKDQIFNAYIKVNNSVMESGLIANYISNVLLCHAWTQHPTLGNFAKSFFNIALNDSNFIKPEPKMIQQEYDDMFFKKIEYYFESNTNKNINFLKAIKSSLQLMFPDNKHISQIHQEEGDRQGKNAEVIKHLLAELPRDKKEAFYYAITPRNTKEIIKYLNNNAKSSNPEKIKEISSLFKAFFEETQQNPPPGYGVTWSYDKQFKKRKMEEETTLQTPPPSKRWSFGGA